MEPKYLIGKLKNCAKSRNTVFMLIKSFEKYSFKLRK